MADRGVPDWTVSSAYPDVAKTTMREWWWEFTRRRPDYRSLWESAEELEGKAHRYAPDVDAFRLHFQLSVIHDPAASLTDWELMQYHYPANYARSPRELLAEQWDKPGADYSAAIAEHRGRMADELGHQLYNFDLSQPLGPQLERVERDLKAVQKELFGKITRRPRRDNWREFLRAIDARDGGATYREIRDVFWPRRASRRDGKEEKTEQSARDTYIAACKLRDNFPI